MACGHLFDRLGYRALNECGDNILKGEEDVSLEEEGVRDFLEHVAIPEEILQSGTVNSIITENDHREYWKKERESTQSSMSRMDFSFYKTVTRTKN